MTTAHSPSDARTSFSAWLLRRIVIFVLLLLGGSLAMLLFFQSKLLYHPDKTLLATPAQIGVTYKDVYFSSANGKKLHAWWVPRKGAKGTILICHGNAGNISHRVALLQMFRDLPVQILLFDYQGYGRSEGSPSEQGTYDDAKAAWDYLTTTRKIPAKRIVVMGRSLGGPIAAHLAQRITPAGLILDSTFSSFVDVAKEHFPWLPIRWIARFRYDTVGSLQTLKVPVLIFHSPNDKVVPYKLGQRCHDKANAPKQFVPLRGGHNDSFLVAARTYQRALKLWLTSNLPVAATPPVSAPTAPRDSQK